MRGGSGLVYNIIFDWVGIGRAEASFLYCFETNKQTNAFCKPPQYPLSCKRKRKSGNNIPLLQAQHKVPLRALGHKARDAEPAGPRAIARSRTGRDVVAQHLVSRARRVHLWRLAESPDERHLGEACEAARVGERAESAGKDVLSPEGGEGAGCEGHYCFVLWLSFPFRGEGGERRGCGIEREVW